MANRPISKTAREGDGLTLLPQVGTEQGRGSRSGGEAPDYATVSVVVPAMNEEGNVAALVGLLNWPVRRLGVYAGFGLELNPARHYTGALRYDFNLHGFHGNGLMAGVELTGPFLLRLEGERLWFIDGGDQPRLGERMAIGAVIETEAGPFVAVSVHLESATTAAYRERQVVGLIAALDEAFPGLPVLIGGDLNTGNHAGGDFEAEGLFRQAAVRGFTRHGGPLDVMTTRPSLITRWPERAMKLDWFLARGLLVGETRIVSSLDETGRPLSDHDLIVCSIEGFE